MITHRDRRERRIDCAEPMAPHEIDGLAAAGWALDRIENKVSPRGNGYQSYVFRWVGAVTQQYTRGQA